MPRACPGMHVWGSSGGAGADEEFSATSKSSIQHRVTSSRIIWDASWLCTSNYASDMPIGSEINSQDSKEIEARVEGLIQEVVNSASTCLKSNKIWDATGYALRVMPLTC